MLRAQLPGVADNGGRSAQRTLHATAGGSTSNSLTSGGRDRELGFKSPARLPGALQALGRKAVGHRGRASPTERVGVRFPRFSGGFRSWSTGTRQGGFDGSTTQVPTRVAGAGRAAVAVRAAAPADRACRP